MENDSPGSRTDRPTAAEARDALDRLNLDGSALAHRVVTPWWYHVALGAIVLALVGSQALPAPASIVLIALAIIAIPVLSMTYSHLCGISTTQSGGPRSRRFLVAAIVVLVVGMASALVMKFAEVSPWWVLIPAVIAAGATVILGRSYDDALRAELGRNAEEPL